MHVVHLPVQQIEREIVNVMNEERKNKSEHFVETAVCKGERDRRLSTGNGCDTLVWELPILR